jgi:3',5'-cyclic AMP phosphodiesterase CpdA
MTRPVLLVQLSDPHIGGTWAPADPVAGLAAAVESVRELPARPEAVLITGDLAEHATPAEYELVRELVEGIGAPVYALPGNHDDRSTLRKTFGLPGDGDAPVQYAVDVGPLRMVVVDTNRPGEDRGELDQHRLGWLDAILGAEADRPTLVAMHHPPLVTGSAAWDAIGLPAADRRALGEILERHPQVRCLVAGHVHRPIVGELAGRVVLTAPSTYVQAKLDLGADRIAFGDEPTGYALHALVDGQIASYLQPVQGAR